jgi:hypothetical protein
MLRSPGRGRSTYNLFDVWKACESGPLLISVVYRYTEVSGDSRKPPMIVGVFSGVNAVRPHVQTRTIEVPRLVVTNTDRRARCTTFLDISATVANAPVLACRSRPRIARGASFVDAELRCNTTLTPNCAA